jgi:hypothetical protein
VQVVTVVRTVAKKLKKEGEGFDFFFLDIDSRR